MKYSMYIGGYGSEGISRVTFRNDRLRLVASYPAVNPSYLCQSPDGQALYVVGETQRFRGEFGGSVQSYAVDENGALTQTAILATGGSDPCHLYRVGDVLLVGNYSSGSLSRFRLTPDGRLDCALPLLQHEGRGAHPERQAGPHVHQAIPTANGRYIAVTDLGLDSVFFYPIEYIQAEHPLPLRVRTPAGYGPRHSVFPRRGSVWYVLCELVSVLLIYRGSPEDAQLIGKIPIGSGAYANAPAALRLSPDERMLAISGRGENIIDLFAIGENGMPARLAEIPSHGDWPRDVQFTPDGRYLLCANERGNTLTAFEISDGYLLYRDSLALSAPSCILFTEMRSEY